MRDLYFENQGTNTYLVYEITENESVDSMSLGMLTNNEIQGLAQTIFIQVDKKRFIKYKVSAKVSVQQFFSGVVNKKRLLGVFEGIVNAMISAEEYMLDPATILLDMNYIFTDVSTCETDLICVPILDEERETVDLGMFFRNIMFSTQFDQTENCDHVAKIINYLNGTPVFSLNEFKKLLEDIHNQQTQPAIKKADSEPAPPTAVTVPACQQTQMAEKQTVPTVNQTSYVQSSRSTLTPAAPDGMRTAAPAKQENVILPIQENSQATKSEISFFYLMQHYNKENAAAYKAQKETKKRNAALSKGKMPKQNECVKQPINNFGFAIPGQSVPTPEVRQQINTQQQTNVQQKKMYSVQDVTPQQTSMTSQSTPIQQPAAVPSEVLQEPEMNFGETTVLVGGATDETTVLTEGKDSAQMVVPYLIRKKNNEKIFLDKPFFRIGKERSYVDYVVDNNKAISRSHANFILREDEYFVADTNSTNHTYVNDTMIQSNTEIRVSHGDVIRLADEEFEFRCY